MADEIEVEAKEIVDPYGDVKLAKSDPLPRDERVKHVFWSGGYDSTAIVLKHLKAGLTVQPYYMKHSAGWEKCNQELWAQAIIRDYLGSPTSLWQPVIWDFDQLLRAPGMDALFRAYDELANAIHISSQYSALRFCKEAVGCKERLELGIVRYDELHTHWSRLAGNDQLGGPLRRFFEGFEFPLWDKMKREIWDEASPMHREVLRKTFSCERSDKEKRSCIERKVPYVNQCVPCQHRIPEAM